VCKTRGATRDSSIVFFVIVFQLVLDKEEEEDDDNTITMNEGKNIIKGSNENDVGEISPLENHPDVVNFTPKTGARWASQKSPTSLFPFTKSKKDVFLSPSPMSLSPSASNDGNKFNVAFGQDDID
jgi:hypothetical protein